MKTVLEMAREAGFLEHEGTLYTNHKFGDCLGELERFAEFVRAYAIATEREACAGECDEWIKNGSALAEDIAATIRARSNT